MNDFVEQCRETWRSLGVPAALAGEMAADLAGDLSEAEAEGLSLEEFLGTSDPSSFAESWAVERGIVPARESVRRRPRFLVAFTAVGAIALLVAVLLLATGNPQVAVDTRGALHVRPPVTAPLPPASGQVLRASAASPVEWILLVLALAALGFAGWLWLSWARSRPPAATA